MSFEDGMSLDSRDLVLHTASVGVTMVVVLLSQKTSAPQTIDCRVESGDEHGFFHKWADGV